MDLGISGKLALLSGASGGIGLEAARVLAADGTRVFLTDLEQGPLDDAASALGDAVGGTAACDLTD